jgi:predicted ATPase
MTAFREKDPRMVFLQKIILRGFKSIRDATIELRPLNILVGANGAGKSNLVLFFKMLNEMMGTRLQQFIGTSGRAQSLLHFGPKVTLQIEAILAFAADNGTDTYHMRLSHAAGDTLVFAEETLSFHPSGRPRPNKPLSLGPGHQETKIGEEADQGTPIAKTFRYLLNNCRVYHFHDTSSTARIRQYCYVGDNRWLMPDAGNLAAVLYRLKTQNGGTAYGRIVKTIRMIAPFFDDFELVPSAEGGRDIILNWRHVESLQTFGPHQLSDGTLRAICLVTLLLQPEDELPRLIIVDEPELGLHPYALNIIASLFNKASHHVQVVVSTQSSAFLDNFVPEDIVVVGRDGKESTFCRQDADQLGSWLEEYSLGEIWEKNVIPGGPH